MREVKTASCNDLRFPAMQSLISPQSNSQVSSLINLANKRFFGYYPVLSARNTITNRGIANVKPRR